MNEELINDVAHWQNLKPPLAPNELEISVYKELIRDSKPVCLLGMTKELVPLCDFAVDLNPLNIGKPTIKSDWNEIANLKVSGVDFNSGKCEISKFHAGAIIGDGPINLTGFQFIEKALSVADKLICRVFMVKQPGMKYAQFFPTEFPGSHVIVNTQDDIAIVMWTR